MGRKEGNELLTDYGSSYVGVKQMKMRYDDNQWFKQKRINEICNKYGIDKNVLFQKVNQLME